MVASFNCNISLQKLYIAPSAQCIKTPFPFSGYCVEGTLAKTILSEPEEITTMVGQKLPLKMSVDYISFSAHTDYQQTSEFIRILRPPHVVLVHGEQNEMSRLKAALQREYEDDPNTSITLHNPRNTQAVELYFRYDRSFTKQNIFSFDHLNETTLKYQILEAKRLQKSWGRWRLKDPNPETQCLGFW